MKCLADCVDTTYSYRAVEFQVVCVGNTRFDQTDDSGSIKNFYVVDEAKGVSSRASGRLRLDRRRAEHP